MLKGVLGAPKQSLSLRSAGRALLGAGMMAGQGGTTRSSAGLALWGLMARCRMQLDLGEAEPKEAEEVSGGRAELWVLRDVGGCV